MNSIDTKTVTLRIEYDSDCENPLTSNDGMWTLHDTRDTEQNFTDRGSKTLPDTLELFWKLRNGLAFIVGGSPEYSGLYATAYDPEAIIRRYMTWDHPAGDMGAKTYADRMRDAQSTLDEYNTWARGECYGFIFNDGRPDEDSCWGFIGADAIRECAPEYGLPDARPLRVILCGELAQFIFRSDSFGADVEVIDEGDYRALLAAEDASERDGMGDYDALERMA
jgi:hypothetical protein